MMWPYGGGGYGMMGGYGGGGGWGIGLFHSIFWVVVLALVVWAIVAFVRSSAGQSNTSPGSAQRSAGLAILEERYARGEVDREEYLQKKRDLVS